MGICPFDLPGMRSAVEKARWGACKRVAGAGYTRQCAWADGALTAAGRK